MIELKTKCEDCVHRKVCMYLNRAAEAVIKLKNTKYDDFDWELVTNADNIEIAFSCLDFRKDIELHNKRYIDK